MEQSEIPKKDEKVENDSQINENSELKDSEHLF